MHPAPGPARRGRRIARKEKGKRKPKEKKPPAHLVAGPELRKLLGVPERTWRRWEEEGLPIAQKGRGGRAGLYDPVAVMRWHLDRDAQSRATPTEDPAAAARGELYQERVRAAKRENDIKEGRLIDVESVRRLQQGISASFRSQLEAFERTQPPETSQAIRSMLDQVERSWRSKLGESPNGNGAADP